MGKIKNWSPFSDEHGWYHDETGIVVRVSKAKVGEKKWMASVYPDADASAPASRLGRFETKNAARRESFSFLRANTVGDLNYGGAFVEDESQESSAQECSGQRSDGGVAMEESDYQSDVDGDVDGVTVDDAEAEDRDGVYTDSSGRYRSPVDRDYDFEWRVPSGVPAYIETDFELTKIRETLANRFEYDEIPHFWLSGPTGSGKTSLAKYVAQQRGAPIFEVEGSYQMNEADLVGAIGHKDDETVWMDSTIPKALLCSQDRETVLIIDEINRIHPKAKAKLLPVLDSRCSITVQQQGGVRIEGDAHNLIVFATTNEGDVYTGSNRMDMAERGRFASKHQVDFLGLSDSDAEASVIVQRSPAGPLLAELLVDVANTVRRQAVDQAHSRIRIGIPTRAMFNWARRAVTYGRMERPDDLTDVESHPSDNPVIEAFEDTVLRPYYDERPDELAAVQSEVADLELDQCPADEGAISQWMTGDVADSFTQSFECKGCGAVFDEDELDSTAQAQMRCPNCSEDLMYQ